MILLKKILRKLYHFIAFLSLFLIVSLPVNAETVTVSYNKLVTTASNLTSGIQCNSSYCVHYNVPVQFNRDFTTLWTGNSSKTCNSQATVSGHLAIEGSGELTINPDWISSNLLSVYLTTNNNNVSYTCNYSNPNNGHLYYTCFVGSMSSSFNIGYTLRRRTTSTAYTNTTSIVYRSVDINCSSSGTGNTQEITDNNNFNTDRVIRDADRNSELEREKIQGNTDAINGLKDNITDSNIDSSDSSINNLKDKIPTNSVISDLLLLPVRFLQNFVNALGSSCSRFSLGSLYGTELFMPCINIESYLGSAIWTTIDLIISGLFVYSLRKKFIQIYQNLTNLKNGGNEVD